MSITEGLTDRGLLEIAEHEGVVLSPYRDSVGVWTWGIGHTKGAGDPDPATMPMSMPNDIEAAIDRALQQFRIDAARYAARVTEAITVGLAPHQFDALVSFDLNTGGIHRARLTDAVNRGEGDASRHFFGWLKPPEIRRRRTAEKRLFDTGDYDHNGDVITVWRTNGAGKLLGPMTTIRGGELLERLQDKPVPADLPPLPDLSDLDLAMGRIEAEAAELEAAIRAARGILGSAA